MKKNNKNFAFTLAEIMIALAVLGVMATMAVPVLVKNSLNKIAVSGLKKAYETIDTVSKTYLTPFSGPTGVALPTFGYTQEEVVKFVKYFIENADIKELYVGENPSEKSQIYTNIKFAVSDIIAGSNSQTLVSPEVFIFDKPSFWMVTDDNIAYSVIIPNKNNKCNDTMSINTAISLSQALEYSCFAFIVDTNGLYKNPNTILDIEDYAKEGKTELNYDRFYVFVGNNGVALGNPQHILSAKLFRIN